MHSELTGARSLAGEALSLELNLRGFLVRKLPCVLRDHHGNAVLNREGKRAGGAEKFLGRGGGFGFAGMSFPLQTGQTKKSGMRWVMDVF